MIDSLHLFLRITDVLTNLLIRDPRILDGIEESSAAHNINAYELFLNEKCKVQFKFHVDKQSK